MVAGVVQSPERDRPPTFQGKGDERIRTLRKPCGGNDVLEFKRGLEKKTSAHGLVTLIGSQ